MKILDKYIAKNFLIGYVISFSVLIGLRVIIELFVNLDEFTEKAELTTIEVVKNILTYYGIRITLYFRDFAGMITVVAAAFSFGKMVRNRELVAIMASGMSLKRVVVPIIALALIATGLLIADQEIIIPPLADLLVRDEDDVEGQESYNVLFISDENGNLLSSQKFDVNSQTLEYPRIILREKTDRPGIWRTNGLITAREGIYDPNNQGWRLLDANLFSRNAQKNSEPLIFYQSDLTAKDLPIRRKSANKSLLSFIQLRKLAKQGAKIKDQAQLYAQMQAHITDPIINLIMLMISLPILLCRDPKSMKSAIIISFTLTSICYIVTFICKLLATETVFDRIIPEFWSWLPIFIFLPIAIIELDSMKT